LIEEKLKSVQKDILDTHHLLGETAEKSRIEITNFFNEIRKVLAERETSLKQKLSEQLKKQEGLLKKKEEKVTKHLNSILSFYQEYQKCLSEDDILLLATSPKRIEIIKQATLDIEKVDLSMPFTELNKENELNSIWKLIQPTAKTPATVLHQRHNNNSSFSQGIKSVKALNALTKNKPLKEDYSS